MSAREAMLETIRVAVRSGANPLPRPAPGPGPGYRHAWDAPRPELLDRMEKRLRDYGAGVTRVASEAAIAGVAAQRLQERGIGSLLVPPGLPAAWRPSGPAVTEDAGQPSAMLDGYAGAMTGCALAIAETGTIVLDAGPRQGRRAVTLLPDYWLCVVLAGQVVGLVPEAVARLRASVDQRRPLTFASGPSATADIELSRVQGVHGPRTLDVILVEAG